MRLTRRKIKIQYCKVTSESAKGILADYAGLRMYAGGAWRCLIPKFTAQ